MFHNVDYEDYPEHWHTAIEIIMPIHEGYNVIVGSKKYCLKEGDILIINGDCMDWKHRQLGNVLSYNSVTTYYIL